MHLCGKESYGLYLGELRRLVTFDQNTGGSYLSNVFKRSAGLTIGQYMVDVRIDKAKRLMRDPQLKFYQVASMVGYMDANYFAKIFKKKTNMTPSEYKESLSVR